MKKLFALAAMSLAVLPGLADAQWYAGARLGYSLAGGKAAQGDKMSDGLKSQVPVQVEGGYRVLPQLAVGGYLSYGPGQVGSVCDGAKCSASVTRLGVEATWRFEQVLALVPWAGLGVGYEWAEYKATDGADTLKLTYRGLEYLDLQAGADYPVTSKLKVGPFASFALGRYTNLKVESPLGNSTGSVPSPTTHSWLTFGVRGSWDF
jgi:hypothetical protein